MPSLEKILEYGLTACQIKHELTRPQNIEKFLQNLTKRVFVGSLQLELR